MTEGRFKGRVAAVTAGGSGMGRAGARQLDVSDNGALRAFFDEIGRERGVLHALWNHAGMAGPTGLGASERDWDSNVAVNLKGAYYGTSYATDLLTAADGRGSVVFTSSTSGLVGSGFSPLYSMAKGGVALMAKAVALNLAPRRPRQRDLPGADRDADAAGIPQPRRSR